MSEPLIKVLKRASALADEHKFCEAIQMLCAAVDAHEQRLNTTKPAQPAAVGFEEPDPMFPMNERERALVDAAWHASAAAERERWARRFDRDPHTQRSGESVAMIIRKNESAP